MPLRLQHTQIQEKDIRMQSRDHTIAPPRN
jgi:hypothetical protein